MRGELGIKIKSISIKNEHFNEEDGLTHDFYIEDETGEFLYIAGDNNIAKLLQEALREYYKNKKIQRRINK